MVLSYYKVKVEREQKGYNCCSFIVWYIVGSKFRHYPLRSIRQACSTLADNQSFFINLLSAYLFALPVVIGTIASR